MRCLHNNLQTVLSVDTGTGANCPLCRLILNMSHRPPSQGAGSRPVPSPPNHTARTGKNIENASFELSYFLVVLDILPVFDATKALSAVLHC